MAATTTTTQIRQGNVKIALHYQDPVIVVVVVVVVTVVIVIVAIVIVIVLLLVATSY